MELQATESRNINFLGRKRINQKDELFKAILQARSDSEAICEFQYDTTKIYQNVKLATSSPTQMILDIFVLGKLHRVTLEKKPSIQRETIIIPDVPERAIPKLRLKIISSKSEEIGKIYAATSKLIPFKAQKENELGESANEDLNILALEPSDQLNGCLVKVEWSIDANINIKVDKKLYHNFEQKPALLYLLIFPDMMRSIAIHLLSRADELPDLDASCSAFHWMQFIEKRLEIPILGEDGIVGRNEVGDLSEITETIVERFMAQKWTDGRTLLEDALHGNRS